jgi:hypothetical protein
LIIESDSCGQHARDHYRPEHVNPRNLTGHFYSFRAASMYRLNERIRLKMVPPDVDRVFTNGDLKRP